MMVLLFHGADLFFNFGRGNHEEHLGEFILNLDSGLFIYVYYLELWWSFCLAE